MRRIVRTSGLRPDFIQQARQPESRFRKLMTRERVGVIEVSRVQLDGMPRGLRQALTVGWQGSIGICSAP